MFDAMVMRKMYRSAEGDPTQLPWHQTEPPRLLRAAVDAKRGGRALDVGCGAGVFSAWMASEGMQVTGLDIIPEAIAMAERTAAAEGVEVELICDSLFAYQPTEGLDLVFDSGCLHSLVGGSVKAYKRRLDTWLRPGGEFVLGHWGKRSALDWRPIGPRRRSKRTIERLFADTLTLVDTEANEFSAPLPFGPRVLGVGYRFRRE